ncbi:MmgE/PrpD family protein [uncultured Roseovarius sp.]|uniref:MmgE/PrpD family protein n=1 Tax=uncultured Roseovarius sp. TaxID=293344 RepID=UPI00345BB840
MIAQRLAEFSAIQSLPRPAMDVMRLSLLDWCAVGVAGRDEPVAKILRDQAVEEGGAPQAALIGSNVRIPARAAALVNGATSHALDYDDTHFAHIGHPSVAVLPAALATAQLCNASGQALQEAALIGAEASIRVGLWLGRAHYQAGFHQTATAGAFGACLSACRLLGLDLAQTVLALGLVSTRASGLKSQFGTMGKPMNAGIAAANGVEAALLAQRGFVSRDDALDGLQGFGPTHHGEGSESAWDGLGQSWLFETVSHKFHACCHGLHAMLEALTPQIGIPVHDIDRVEIMTHSRWLSVCNIEVPKTGLEAKFSYRLTAAMRLAGYDTSLPDSFNDRLCRDESLVALRDRVRVSAQETLSEMQAHVVLHTIHGTKHELTHDLDAPLPYADREVRLRAKATALIGLDRAEKLWRMISDAAPPDTIASAISN